MKSREQYADDRCLSMIRKNHAMEVECRRQLEVISEIHKEQKLEAEAKYDVLQKKLELVQKEKDAI